MAGGKAPLYGKFIILESDDELSSQRQPLRALSEEIFRILQANFPFGPVTAKHRQGNRWRLNQVNRTMHVHPDNFSIRKIRDKNEPDWNLAREIALRFESEVRKNETATISEFEWAFWKPILVYAMSTEYKKLFVLDQLVQVLLRLQCRKAPSVLGTDFYATLRGLHQAWDTCECFAPLSPPPFQRESFLDNYPNLHERWPFSMSVLYSEAFPSMQLLKKDTRPWNMPSIPSSDGSEGSEYMTRDHWRNLNDFTARLYAVQTRMAGDMWRSGDFGSVTAQLGWWSWKALYALIEAFEETEQAKSIEATNTAYSVALSWLSYHGPNLRKTDFVKDLRDRTGDAGATNSATTNAGENSHQSHMVTDISHPREANAVASLFPMLAMSEPDPMAARWFAWFEHLDTSESRLPSKSEDSELENPQTEKSESRNSADSVVCSNLVKALDDQMRKILADYVAQQRIGGPADRDLEYNASHNGDWQHDMEMTFKEKWDKLKRKIPEEHRKREGKGLRKHIEEVFRQRLYRQDTEQQFLYPFFERNAVQRKHMVRVGNSWMWKTDKMVEEAAQWSRILLQSKMEVIDAQQLASQLKLRYDLGDTVQDVLAKYWAPCVDVTLDKLREPLPKEADPLKQIHQF